MPAPAGPVLTVNVTVVVGTRTTSTHVRRGGHVRFSGTVQPKVANLPVAIQKLNAQHHWVTISGTITRNGGTLLMKSNAGSAELFAESPTHFFSKVVDIQAEFDPVEHTVQVSVGEDGGEKVKKK